jgi:CelD/BcsL family acetyltransferase involved in cellulose biosynthesis
MFARAAEDRVRGWILFHCERPIAYLYCPLVRDGILVYLYLGYDPEYQAWSPGTVLHFLVLRKLFQDGRFRMFDFAEGEGGHKEFLSTHHVLCADIYWIRPTLRNRVLLRLHILVEMVNTLAGRLLAALGLKTGLKRLIRRRICPPGTYET